MRPWNGAPEGRGLQAIVKFNGRVPSRLLLPPRRAHHLGRGLIERRCRPGPGRDCTTDFRDFLRRGLIERMITPRRREENYLPNSRAGASVNGGGWILWRAAEHRLQSLEERRCF